MSKTDKKLEENVKLKKKRNKSKPMALALRKSLQTKDEPQQQVVELSKSEITKAIHILNKKETRTPYKVIEDKRRSQKCKLPSYELQRNHNQVHFAQTSMSYVNITRHMRQCILIHDWDNLTKLLISFFDAKKQTCIKLRNAFINLFNNPNAIRYNFLNEFLHMYISCQTDEDKSNFINRLLSLDSMEHETDTENAITEIVL